MSTLYVPILKWRKGEQLALKNLNVPQRQLLTPLIEVVDDLDSDKFAESLDKCYEYPIYVDTFNVERTEITLLAQLITELNNRKREAYPVLYFDNLIRDFTSMSSHANRIAIRIPIPEQIDGPNYEEYIDEIGRCNKNHPNVLIDLILDLGVIDNEKEASYSLNATKDFLANYISGNFVYNKIILAVTSFPENLQTVPKAGSIEYKRLDYLIFKKIYQDTNLAHLKDFILYADYGVTKFSDSEIDFSKLRYGVLPKVRYTTNTVYWVLKGDKDVQSRTLTKNYCDLANDILNSSKYYGENFSFGDMDIKERALGLNKKGPGGHKEWVTISANHHLVVLIQQLSNLYGI